MDPKAKTLLVAGAFVGASLVAGYALGLASASLSDAFIRENAPGLSAPPPGLVGINPTGGKDVKIIMTIFSVLTGGLI